MTHCVARHPINPCAPTNAALSTLDDSVCCQRSCVFFHCALYNMHYVSRYHKHQVLAHWLLSVVLWTLTALTPKLQGKTEQAHVRN